MLEWKTTLSEVESMATRGSDKKFLIGLLVGAGVGLAVAYLLDPEHGRRNRERIVDGARKVANRITHESGHGAWGRHKIERAGRKLAKQIERARSTGF